MGKLLVSHLIFASVFSESAVVGHPNGQTLPFGSRQLNIFARWMLPVYSCVTGVLSWEFTRNKAWFSLAGVELVLTCTI